MSTVANPSYAQVTEIPSILEGTVGREHLDYNQHMNVVHYFTLAEIASTEQLSTSGFGESYLLRGHSLFTAEHHLSYLSELREGDQYTGHSLLSGRSDRAFHAFSFLTNRTTQAVSLIMELMIINIDMAIRKVAPFDDQALKDLDSLIARQPELTWRLPTGRTIALR